MIAALIVGLGGIVAVALAGYLLGFRVLRRADLESARADAAQRELDAKTIALAVDSTSILALRAEIADLHTVNQVLDAKRVTAERQRDELLHSIETAPTGAPAIAAVLRIELERMRTLSKPGPDASAASGDQAGGDAGIVHVSPTGDTAKP